MTTAQYRKPLPGTALDYFDAREAVNAIAPGAARRAPPDGCDAPLAAVSSTATDPLRAATRVTQTTRGRPTLVETAPRFGGADLSAGPTERIPDPQAPCNWHSGG